MTNHLAEELSPYLLQHAENPVDWWPWCDEAIELARQTDRPIFLSIGYSACHWCHVMEHESFESDQIAAVLNENFVSIKVDREERPDLDQLYMNAVQMITGRGGWPMSVFLDHDLQPFFAGTYWPPSAQRGMPGFDNVLAQVLAAWRDQREQVTAQAGTIAERLSQVAAMPEARGAVGESLLHDAAAQLERVFDHTHGGFGGAPKFPHPMDLGVLLRYWRRKGGAAVLQMVTHTLDKMAAGGIYDHLGGGFARYSVDERWLVPHFEKMLYDNALLARCYVETYQATGVAQYADVARDTLDFVLRDMTDPSGGFYSALDADSEGVEGKFYVWTPAEVESLLDAESARLFAYVYDVTPGGNFEGKSVLNRSKTFEQCAALLEIPLDELTSKLAESRRLLLAARGERVPPATDDKVLVSWNSLMIDAMALAGGALAEDRYLEAAQRAASFILDQMRSPEGTLLHTYRAGQARYDAYLDDYAGLATALVTLYENDFDERWIDNAVDLVDQMIERFADDEGGFYYTHAAAEMPIARHKDFQDASVPSGNGLAATALVRLGRLAGRDDYLAAAERTFETFAGYLARTTSAAGQMLLALDVHQSAPSEVVLLGGAEHGDAAGVLDNLHRQFLPHVSLAFRAARGTANRSRHLERAFAGKEPPRGDVRLYLCSGYACEQPVDGSEAAQAAIDRLTRTA